MNKVEGLRGFLTFCLILIALILLFFSVRFIMSKRTLKEESKASSNIVQIQPVIEQPSSETQPLAPEPVSVQGFQQAISEQDVRYDLNKDNIVNMYDYYLLVSSLNQAPNNN